MCLITEPNSKDMSIPWHIKTPKINEMGSFLVLLTYPFKHFNWQTLSNPLTAPGGVLVEHQRDGGRMWHDTGAGSELRQMKSVSQLLKACHSPYHCLVELAWYTDLLYYSAGLIFLFMTSLPWRPSISLQCWRMTLTEWYFNIIYNPILETEVMVASNCSEEFQ